MTTRFTGTLALHARVDEGIDVRRADIRFVTTLMDGLWRLRPEDVSITPHAENAGTGAALTVTVTLAKTVNGEIDTGTGQMRIKPVFRLTALGQPWLVQADLDTAATAVGFPGSPLGSEPQVSGTPLGPDGEVALAGAGRLDGSRLGRLAGADVLVRLWGRFDPPPAGDS